MKAMIGLSSLLMTAGVILPLSGGSMLHGAESAIVTAIPMSAAVQQDPTPGSWSSWIDTAFYVQEDWTPANYQPNWTYHTKCDVSTGRCVSAPQEAIYCQEEASTRRLLGILTGIVRCRDG